MPGDEAGRGSIVFFSQSTMATGPRIGCGTLKQHMAAGGSGTNDFGSDINAAFHRMAVVEHMSQDMVDKFVDHPPTPADFAA